MKFTLLISTLLAAQVAGQATPDWTPPAAGQNLYELVTDGSYVWPWCGDSGQVAPHNGCQTNQASKGPWDCNGQADLVGGSVPRNEDCHKINICHGNASGENSNNGGWNAITVDRSSLTTADDPQSNNGGGKGHSGLNHNDETQGNKRADYLPGTTGVTDPRTGRTGRLDEDCDFIPDVCGASCGGDPHMKLWNGDFYDYHGQCDLVLIDAPEFGNGLGLTIHIRTKIRYDYSFVESCSVKVGDDVLEVSSWGYYQFNGVASAHMPKQMGHFKVDYEQLSRQKHRFFMQLQHEGEYIEIVTFKDWVSVKIDGATEKNFAASVGLMGEYLTGKRLARDGKTILEDNNEFGQEWQVLDTEPMLFSADRAPQQADGQKCILPAEKAQQRRLGEATVSLEAAEKACGFLKLSDPKHVEMCVYDVMASGDLEMAEAGVY